ncbi:MAG TPA: hypothetical protein TECP_01358 [Hyphomicrobiaceae bacterium MAG_BT-2024]
MCTPADNAFKKLLKSKVVSKDITGKRLEPKTVQEQTIAVNATSGVKINNAKVVTADVKVSYGVIYNDRQHDYLKILMLQNQKNRAYSLFSIL